MQYLIKIKTLMDNKVVGDVVIDVEDVILYTLYKLLSHCQSFKTKFKLC